MLKLDCCSRARCQVEPDGLPVGFVKDVGEAAELARFQLHDLLPLRRSISRASATASTAARPCCSGRSGRSCPPVLRAAERPATGRTSSLILRQDPGHQGQPAAQMPLSTADVETIVSTKATTRNLPHGRLPLPRSHRRQRRILNKVYHRAFKPPVASGTTSTTAAERAHVASPVSLGHPQHDYVQWNGVASNAGVGSIGRNVGGTPAFLASSRSPSTRGIGVFIDSSKFRNLLRRSKIGSNRSGLPSGPAAARCHQPGRCATPAGRSSKAQCSTCHNDINRTDKFRRIAAKMQAVAPRTAWRSISPSGSATRAISRRSSVVGSKLLVPHNSKDKGPGGTCCPRRHRHDPRLSVPGPGGRADLDQLRSRRWPWLQEAGDRWRRTA